MVSEFGPSLLKSKKPISGKTTSQDLAHLRRKGLAASN
jgi:hypothetical protein